MSDYLVVMKEIRITLEDQEYNQVLKLKKDRTWKEFFLNGCVRRDINGDKEK